MFDGEGEGVSVDDGEGVCVDGVDASVGDADAVRVSCAVGVLLGIGVLVAVGVLLAVGGVGVFVTVGVADGELPITLILKVVAAGLSPVLRALWFTLFPAP